MPPILVFKGVPEGTLEKRLNKLPEVKNHNIYIPYQSNAWVDSSTFIKWLNQIWFKAYPYKPIERSILYYDKAPSHITEEVINLFVENNCYYRLIPSRLTSYCQPLDLSINKPFKDSLKAKYRQFCIDNKNTVKPTPEDIVRWVSKIWWSNNITEETIKHSFKKGGINLKNDGTEDGLFQWPKAQDYILIEDLPELKNENTFNVLNLNSQDSENYGNDVTDGDEDTLFDYDRYSISSIRKEVIKNLKINYSNEDIEIDDYDNLKKNYEYYEVFGMFK